MNIEVMSKIEIRVGENSIILSKFDARKLIKQLQEAVGEEESPKYTGGLTHPAGVRKVNPYENVRGNQFELGPVPTQYEARTAQNFGE